MKSKHLQMIGGDANEITAKDLPTEILVHIRVLFFYEAGKKRDNGNPSNKMRNR